MSFFQRDRRISTARSAVEEAMSPKDLASGDVSAGSPKLHSAHFYSFSVVFAHSQVLLDMGEDHETVIKSSVLRLPEHILHFQYCQTREQKSIRGLEEF